MNSDKTGSAGSSGATSPSKPLPTVTEAEFLQRQMEQAGMAIAQTASDLQTRLKEGLDVKAWSAQFPWITLGVAAAAGFFVGSAVTPSREQTFQERLKSLFPEVAAAPETTASASPADASAAAKKP